MVKGSLSNLARARLAATSLKALGWEFVGPPPAPSHAVCLAVPHTSNLDGVLMVLMAQSIGLEISWMVKDALDRPLVGDLVRATGGILIDRSKPNGVVGQMVEEFGRRDRLCLLVPPEGTRSRREYWKSGFYHIARSADVPLIPGFLDYRAKRGGFGEPISLTGNIREDMDAIRRFYTEGDYQPRYPDKFGPIRLREEDEQDDA